MSDIDTSRPQSCGCGEAAYADCACNPKPLPWGSGQATFPPGAQSPSRVPAPVDTSPAALRALAAKAGLTEPADRMAAPFWAAAARDALRALAAEKEAATVKTDLTVGATDRPERLWLSAPDADGDHGVWFDGGEGGTEYVRADIADDLRTRLAAAEQDRDAADASAEAIEAKFATLCRVGRDCGCSYDAKEHVCMYHSPQLVAAVERAEEAERGRDQAISMAEAAAKFAVADDVERAALKARAEKAEAERERPLTARDMADVFGCVWNAAIGAAHREQRGMEFATILAEAFGAMAYRLQEIAAEENFAHVEVTAAPANPEDPAHD